MRDKELAEAQAAYGYKVWLNWFPFGLKWPGFIGSKNKIFQLGIVASLDAPSLVIVLGVFHLQLGWLRQLP